MTDLSAAFQWTSRTTAAGPSRIGGLFGALLREIRIRRALRHVSTLDDAMLCDIGLSRGGLEEAVRHGRHLD